MRRVEKVETAVEPRFQEHFVNAMAIPHETDAYERLGAVVPLPPRRTSAAADRDDTTPPGRRQGGDRHDETWPRREAAGAVAARDARRRVCTRTSSASLS